MPNSSQHMNKAARNEQFLDSIEIGEAPEWAATVAFYAALHHVERLRSHSGGGDSSSHADRLAYLRQSFPALFSAFKRLYEASLLARYESSAKFFSHYSAASVRDVLVAQLLHEVRDFVEVACAPPAAP